MSWSLQKHIPPSPKPHWPKRIFHSSQHFLSVISHVHPLSVEASTFSKKLPPFPLAVQMKVLLVENSKSSTFKVLPQNIKLAFSEEVGLDSGKIDSVEK